jgi:hypothetical protein
VTASELTAVGQLVRARSGAVSDGVDGPAAGFVLLEHAHHVVGDGRGELPGIIIIIGETTPVLGEVLVGVRVGNRAVTSSAYPIDISE